VSAVRLRPSVQYTPVRDGVYFAGRGDGFVLHGPPSLARVADVVVALLDDGTTEAELLAAVPAGAAQQVAVRILAELRQRDMLLDLAALTVPSVPAEDHAAYGDTIAHLEAMSDDPYAAFLAVRAAEVAVRGGGDAADRARAALAALGARVTDGVTPDTTVLVEITNDPAYDALAATAARALDTGLPLVHCLVTDSAVVVSGPGTSPEHPRLADAVRRAAARHAAGLPAPVFAGVPNPVLDAFGGNLAAHRAFRWVAGLRDPAGRVLLVDGPTLDVTEHTVTSGEPDDSAAPFLDRAQVLYDEAFGVLGTPSPFGLAQSPVFATAVRIVGGGEAYGFGLTEEESRYRGLAEAVRGLGSEPVAIGPTAAAATVDAVARSLLRRWVRDGCAGGSVAFADVTDAHARLCWKTLAVRHGRDVAVARIRPERAPIWLVAVRESGRLACAGYGLGPDRALRDTLVTALGAVQAGVPAPDAGWLDGPDVADTTDVLPEIEVVLAAVTELAGR
jgi:hypothetical protein